MVQTTEAVASHVKRRLKSEWHDVKLGDLIKRSWNYTFGGTRGESGEQVVIRAVPNGRKERARVEAEVKLLVYLEKHTSLSCTRVISNDKGEYIGGDDESGEDILILVFPFAPGNPVDTGSWEWMNDERHVKAVGTWLGNFHAHSKALPADLRSEFRPWDQLYDGLLSGEPVHPEDEAMKDDPTRYGVLHGDVIFVNYFLREEAGELKIHVFDWDEAQLGWYAMDLAQWIFMALRVQWSVVADEKILQTTDWFVKAYEASSGVKVDTQHLWRMVALRRQFYFRFAKREMEICQLPADSHAFFVQTLKIHEETEEQFRNLMRNRTCGKCL